MSSVAVNTSMEEPPSDHSEPIMNSRRPPTPLRMTVPTLSAAAWPVRSTIITLFMARKLRMEATTRGSVTFQISQPWMAGLRSMNSRCSSGTHQ